MADAPGQNLSKFGKSFYATTIEQDLSDQDDESYDGPYKNYEASKSNWTDNTKQTERNKLQVKKEHNKQNQVETKKVQNSTLHNCLGSTAEEYTASQVKTKERPEMLSYINEEILFSPGMINYSEEHRIHRNPQYEHTDYTVISSDELLNKDIKLKAQKVNYRDVNEFNDNSIDTESTISMISYFGTQRFPIQSTKNNEKLKISVVPYTNSDSTNSTASSTNYSQVVNDKSCAFDNRDDLSVTRIKERTALDLSIISNCSTSLTPNQLLLLRQAGFPLGLSLQLVQSISKLPVRFWIIDNSGSMRTSDCEQVRTSFSKPGESSTTSSLFSGIHLAKTFVASCTRWKELQGTLIDHAELAGLLQIPTNFRLINKPSLSVGSQECSVAFTKRRMESPDLYADVQEFLRVIRRTTPNGSTPLTKHLLELQQRIEQIQPFLELEERSVVIVVATDGLPTDKDGRSTKEEQNDFLEVLRSIQKMSVQVVIRLCSKNDEIVQFYHNLDKDLELQVDVITDFLSEAKQIHLHNKWLNYGISLHRCREMGFYNTIFDILNERQLTKDELLEFLKILFGWDKFRNAPNIHTEWKMFKSLLTRIVKAEGKQWCPITQRMDYWIDFYWLEKVYGKGRFVWSWNHTIKHTNRAIGKDVTKLVSEKINRNPEPIVSVNFREQQQRLPKKFNWSQ